MQIVKLTAENFKRLVAVEITPKGNVIQITGKNGAGKSSVLDSIQAALAGKESIPLKPVRTGAKKACITIDLGEFTVIRTITEEGGGTLTVASKDGARYPSPQAMLDKLTGKLCFDPVAFSRQDPKVQAQTLRKLVGLDFTHLEEVRASAYSERTVVNRDVKALEAQLAAAPRFVDAPAEEVDVNAILAEWKKARAVNGEKARLKLEEENAQEQERSYQGTLERLKREYEEAKALRDKWRDNEEAAHLAFEAAPTADESAFEQQAQNVQEVNRKVRANALAAEIAVRLEKRKALAAEHTAAIEKADAEKAKQLQAAKYPVEGLGVDDDGVTFNGIPFSQASSAEQLRVSAAMALALNPKLRVILIRDGSLLDSEQGAALCKFAEENNCQVWLEQVSTDKAVGIVIEDGHLSTAEVTPNV